MSERKKKLLARKQRREGYVREVTSRAGPLRLPSPYLMERTLRDMQEALEGKEFDSREEYNQYLNGLMGRGLEKALGGRERSAQEQAQEFAYQAMEAESREEAGALARRALQLDPECVDALVTMARVEGRSANECLSMLLDAVRAGERSLGKDFFRENMGHFWSLVETRPYMRARHSVASLFRMAGRTGEAIRHFEAMLELNPNDNQGVRDDLLGCYLSTDNLKGARRLLEQFKEDTGAIFNWGRVLERYLSGELAAARRELEKAMKQNPYVQAYLAGQKQLHYPLPSYYACGEETEAVQCAVTQGEAWRRHPAAVAWLRAGGTIS